MAQAELGMRQELMGPEGAEQAGSPNPDQPANGACVGPGLTTEEKLKAIVAPLHVWKTVAATFLRDHAAKREVRLAAGGLLLAWAIASERRLDGKA